MRARSLVSEGPGLPERARRIARKAAKAAVLPMGIRGARPGDLTVLLYHRIQRGNSVAGREVDVTAAAFDRQMASLAEAGTAMSIDDALAPYLTKGVGSCLGPSGAGSEVDSGWAGQAVRGPSNRRAAGPGHGGSARVVVTFDDGFRDFVDVALPVLVGHGVQATLYLATGLVSSEAAAPPDRLSWGDLREAVATGLVTIGAHTHSHPDLSRAGESEARDELRRSKELIEDHLGVACRHFAYPYSKSSPAAERVARELFDSGALTWGTNRAGRVDLHRLARVPVLRSDGPLFFWAKVEGRLDGEALVYQALRRGPWRAS